MKIVIIKKKKSCVLSINIEQFCFQLTDFHEFVLGRVVKSVKTTDPSITSLQECKDS